MSISDWVTTTISILSLIVSVITAYLTLLRKPKAVVVIRRRVGLVQIDGVPCIVANCDISNPGARGVFVEDLMLQLKHSGSGSKFSFAPYLVMDRYNVFESFQRQNRDPFTSISVGPKERLERAVVFRPMLGEFKPSNGIFHIELVSSSGGKKGWKKSSSGFSIELDEKAAQDWTSIKGANMQKEAVEIGQKRRELFDNMP